MLKPSEELFKFPVRIFDPVEIDEEEYHLELTNKPPERQIREYAIAWKRIPIKKISDWGESFERGRTIQDIIKHGFDCTLVFVGDDSYICDWNMNKFEKEYDKHFRRLQKHATLLAEEDFLELIKTEELEKELNKTNE